MLRLSAEAGQESASGSNQVTNGHFLGINAHQHDMLRDTFVHFGFRGVGGLMTLRRGKLLCPDH